MCAWSAAASAVLQHKVSANIPRMQGSQKIHLYNGSYGLWIDTQEDRDIDINAMGDPTFSNYVC